MTVATLLMLALSASVSLVPARAPLPQWVPASVTAASIGLAAVFGAIGAHATGFGLAVTYVVTVTAAALGGSPIVTVVFRLARRDGTPAADSSAGPLHGGRTIGILERTAVAASILAGWPEGIAIVLAVKGLARYPELRGSDASSGPPSTTAASSASEQFIIGTFTSVMWAVSVCGVGHALVS